MPHRRDASDIVVLGCPRSGTSMVAQLLSAAGVDFGTTLLAPSPDNPRGFFEDTRATDLDDELLAPLVVDRGALPVPEPRLAWAGAPAVGRRARAEAAQIRRMREILAGPGRRGLKDPRLVWTIDAWEPALRPGTLRVVVFRRPEEVAASLHAMWDRDRAYYGALEVSVARGIALWEAVGRRLLTRLRGPGRDRCLVVDHADLLDGGAVGALAAFASVSATADAVDPALHRSRARGVPAPRSAREVHAALRDQALADAERWTSRVA